LRKSEERFRLLVENSSELISILESDGIIRYQSPSAERVLGYKAEYLVGKSVFDFIHPDDLERIIKTFTDWLGIPGFALPVECRFLHRDGSWRILEAIGNNLLDDPLVAGVMVNSRDITERKRTEAALKQSERQYRNLFENANDAIMIIEPESEMILEANNKACVTYGFSKDEFIGMSLKSITQDVGRGEQRIREVLQETGTTSFESVHLRKDGTAIEILGSDSVIEYDGKKAILIIARDITEINRLQQQLIQSEKLAGLGQLVSGVAHELNNPLTAVIGFTQLILADPSLDRKVRERLETVMQEGERTRRIVQNLLSFSRQHKPSRKNVNLNDLLERTLELRAYELRVNNISVHRELEDIPSIFADGHQLQQVFLNIIINAEQALQNGKGKGVLTVKTEIKEVDSIRWVRVIIADDGPGIALENMSKLFDPFFTTKPVGKGTGLGLSISYGIVKEHGGTIRVESSPGSGATFIIELPVQSG